MSEATLIYPHQLFEHSPALSVARPVYLIEEPLLLTYNPIHIQKLIFHKLSLDAYEKKLRALGYTVNRITIHNNPTTTAVFTSLRAVGVSTIHVVDTTDNYLEKSLATSGLIRVYYDSPLFLLGKKEACARYVESKRFMAAFYKKLRQDTGILMTNDSKPEGGKWSYDAENRKKLPKKKVLPDDFATLPGTECDDAINWANSIGATTYGEPGVYFPTTHADAATSLQEFFEKRFALFGTYEDAMSTDHTRLFHSGISPLLNVGLLTPNYVITETLAYATAHHIPLSALEGFIRQILGWREFIRASYEVDGTTMRRSNFWQHTRPLPASFWNGTTGITPVDTVIKRALQYSYTHHIERLMVMGNFLLLTETHPDETYRWFMGMYIDAYDWVMVPNVYSMSQFADGGIFATKPYISGSNYLSKMSTYTTGPWTEIWTSLYWNFIEKNRAFFVKNNRLSMMPRLLDKMPPDQRQKLTHSALAYLTSL